MVAIWAVLFLVVAILCGGAMGALTWMSSQRSARSVAAGITAAGVVLVAECDLALSAITTLTS